LSQSTAENASPVRRSAQVGIVLVFLAALMWSLNGALIKIVTDGGKGPNGVAIAFYRSLFAGLFLLPMARGKWRTLALDAGPSGVGWRTLVPRPVAAWCMVFFTLMTAFFVVANTMTEAGNVIVLQYTSTFWVFGLSPMILREKPRTADLWILGLAFCGVVIVFAGDARADLPGLVVALASGLFYALLTMMIRRLRNSDSAAVTVFNNLGSAVLLLPIVFFAGSLALSTRSLLLLILMGVVQFGIPYYLYTLGLARIPAYQAALITMLEPVLVPIWAFLAVGETVPKMTMIGGGVILLALVLFVNAARRAHASVIPESTI